MSAWRAAIARVLVACVEEGRRVVIARRVPSPRCLAGAGVILLAVAAGVGGVLGGAGDSTESVAIPKELSVENLKAQSANPGKLMELVRETVGRADLTEEQHRQIGRNLHKVMEAKMDDRIEEFLSATDEERTWILDKHIDEMEEHRKTMEARRKEEKRPEEGEPRPPRRREPPTQQERKTMSETRSPDRMARGMAYFTALRKRMGERGIRGPCSPQSSGPPGPGPGGGGPGGAGPPGPPPF
jgi:hypothetical protein